MPKQVIIKHPNWWKLVAAQMKPKYLSMSPQAFEFSIDFPKEALAAVDKDPLLQARLWEPAQKEWAGMVKNLAVSARRSESYIDDIMGDAGKEDPAKTKSKLDSAKKQFHSTCAAVVAKHEADMKKKVNAVWKKIQAEKTELKKHRIKLGFTMALRIGALGLTGLSLFLSGGTNGLAWYALFRQLVSGGKKLRQGFKSAEKLAMEIARDLKVLEKRAIKHPMLQKANIAANALTISALGSDFSKNVNDISQKVQSLKQKRLKLQNEAHALSADVNKLMKKVGDQKTSAPANVQKRYDAMLAEIDKLLKKITKTQGTISEVEKVEKKVEKPLADLRKAQSAGAIKGVVVVLTMVGGLARAVALDLASDDSQIEACIDGLEKAGDSIKNGMDTFSKNLGNTLKAAA